MKKFISSMAAAALTASTMLGAVAAAEYEKHSNITDFNKNNEYYQADEMTESKISTDLISKINEEPFQRQLVYVWYKEINSTDIEIAIKNEIGFDLDSLQADFVSPSKELIENLAIAANGNVTTSIKDFMEVHLKKTESERLIEEEKTDLYLESKRDIVSEQHLDKVNSIIESAEISNENIIFKSQAAPMMICELSFDEIKKLAENNDIEKITPYEEMKFEICSPNAKSMQGAKNSLEINRVNEYLNLTGKNIKIGIFGVCSVSDCYATDNGIDMSKVVRIGPLVDPTTNPNATNHETYCAGIVAGSKGIAPDATIYTVAAHKQDPNIEPFDCIEEMVERGVSVINVSWGMYHTSNYCSNCKFFDSLVNNYNVTVICSTGNNSENNVLCPSSAYNTIAVNGYCHENPVTHETENVLNNYAYMHGNGCLKPDIVAPSLNNGTSTSAPLVTGMIAMLFEYKPSLKAYPEVVKTIVMASCHEKCSKLYINNSNISNFNETMESGLTDRQGAGIPNFYNMISIAAQHNYYYGILNKNNNFRKEFNFVQQKNGRDKLNVAMSYLQTEVMVEDPYTRDDFDISLSNSSFYSLKISNKGNSSTELIYTDTASNENYKLNIYRYPNSSTIKMEEVRYCIAWSTNNIEL